MTEFDKPVTRRTRGAYPVLYLKPAKIVVRLAPGDLIEFRQSGRRHRWALPVDMVFKYAVRLKAEAEVVARRAKRKGGGL